MESPVELVKEFGAIPVGGTLAFLMWKMIQLVEKAVENHMNHIQENTEIIKDGIQGLKGSADKTLFHLGRQTELLEKIANK